MQTSSGFSKVKNRNQRRGVTLRSAVGATPPLCRQSRARCRYELGKPQRPAAEGDQTRNPAAGKECSKRPNGPELCSGVQNMERARQCENSVSGQSCHVPGPEFGRRCQASHAPSSFIHSPEVTYCPHFLVEYRIIVQELAQSIK